MNKRLIYILFIVFCIILITWIGTYLDTIIDEWARNPLYATEVILFLTCIFSIIYNAYNLNEGD